MNFFGKPGGCKTLHGFIKKDIHRDSPSHQQAINRTWAHICEFQLHFTFSLPSELSHILTLPAEVTLNRVVDAGNLLRAYQQHHQAWADTCNLHAKETQRQQLWQSKHSRAAYRHVAANFISPPAALQKDDGSLITGATDMDELLRDKCGGTQGYVTLRLKNPLVILFFR